MVEAVLVLLEDCPFFNAGKGSVYTNAGTHEMDAAIMDGETEACGACAGVSHVKCDAADVYPPPFLLFLLIMAMIIIIIQNVIYTQAVQITIMITMIA